MISKDVERYPFFSWLNVVIFSSEMREVTDTDVNEIKDKDLESLSKENLKELENKVLKEKHRRYEIEERKRLERSNSLIGKYYISSDAKEMIKVISVHSGNEYMFDCLNIHCGDIDNLSLSALDDFNPLTASKPRILWLQNFVKNFKP